MKLGWVVDVMHSFLNVIERLLSQELEWDKPQNDDDSGEEGNRLKATAK